MEGLGNGGMLYHEVQESKLCAVHCVNTALQGPFFSEFDLAALASDLDRKERQMMLEGGAGEGLAPEESHNVSLDGDFSIQVLQKALEIWDLQVIPLNSPVAEPAQIDPELENAFICHLQDHWFCIRRVNGEWYNFNSLYPAPEHLSKFYLSAYLDTLKSCGWSIFIVRGNFPKECPMASSEASNGFGQWLLPEDAERITKSCNPAQRPPYRTGMGEQAFESFSPYEVGDDDDEDLKAAIAASLVYSPSSGTDAAEVASSIGEGKGNGLVESSSTTAVGGGANSRDETNNNSSVDSVASATTIDGAATSRDEMKNGLMESSSPTTATDGAAAGAAEDEKKMTNE